MRMCHRTAIADWGNVGRKQLARTHKAYPLQGPRREVNIADLNRVCIRIRIAGDLTQNPVVTSTGSDYNGWPKLAGRKVREGEADEDYRTC
ncbi:hypothetical protein HQ563_11780 [bacterium]|nr:hypothetical protein [bacterium]